MFYLGLALNPKYVEGCLERMGKDDDGEDVLLGVWDGANHRDSSLEPLKSGVEVRLGRPPGFSNLPKKRFGYSPKAETSKNRNLW